VVDTLPAGVSLAGVATTAGACDTASAGQVVCALGLVSPTLASPPVTIAITVMATAEGDAVNTAVVSSSTLDPSLANNSATAVVRVVLPQVQADLTISLTASAAQVVVGTDFTYTLTAINNGPDAATPQVQDSLPAAVGFVSFTHPNASCQLVVTTVQCVANQPLSSGQSVQMVQITVHTLQAGQITDTAGVSGGIIDPAPFNNTATVTVTARLLDISDLIVRVQTFELPRGISTSLIGKLDTASADLVSGDLPGACGNLGAFSNEVDAQSGKALTTDQALALTSGAATVETTIGCP
jgi:uncharacterized repeat protein (TIGR01451 family)